jgi:pSer/pThr/pTyr-binding forkhead associated (FHA) protein
MKSPLRISLAALFLSILVSQSVAFPASAQMGLRVNILSLDTNEFPTLSASVSVTDDSGAYIANLPATSFQIFEDENPLPGLVMQSKRVGTQQLFVVNTIAGLQGRIPSGESFYGLVQDALSDWWSRLDASEVGLDDLTLITNEDTLVAHVGSAAILSAALDQFKPDFSANDTSADLLLQALSIATDAQPRAGMPRHIIFLTPYIYSLVDVPLANVIARAVETQTSIHVVFLAAEQALGFVGTESLRQLSRETGGIFLHFDPTQGLGRITEQVLTQRELYELTFTSHTNISGRHSVQVRISDGNLEGLSSLHSYLIEVQPPELAFIQPPAMISRQPSDPDRPIETLSPSSLPLNLLITFPDDHPRPLTSTWLVVDGEVVDQRSQAPFDVFHWDLSDYMQGEMHYVKAVAQDTLGLEGTSPETQIFVDVPPPPSGFSALRPALSSLLAALAVLVAGVVLAVTLLNLSQRSRKIPREQDEPTPRPAIRIKRASLQPPDAVQPAEAYLTPLEHSVPDLQAIPLTGVDLTLGRDASLAAFPIEDPSVSSLHARLIRSASGRYLLRDQGSVAGTWVNYEAVSEQGRELKHGDLIHLGRVAFRFQLKNPPAERKPSDRQYSSPESE